MPQCYSLTPVQFEHGRLFNKAFTDRFGTKLGEEGFWLGLGKCNAYLMCCLPLALKLKVASLTEALAVKMLTKDIAAGPQNPYTEVAKRILPDEIHHAEYTPILP